MTDPTLTPPIPELVAATVQAKPVAERQSTAWWLSGWFVIPLLVALVFLARVPSLSRSDELNPDESQMLAQAMRFAQDPVPWRSVDSTTSGPMNSWLLLAAHWCGLPLNYTGTHLLAAMLLAALVALTYATIRQLAEPLAAIAAGATALVFVVVAQEGNFTHYSSELLPAVITAGVMLCFAIRLTRPRPTLASDCVSSVLIGMLPWTKLQAAPIAVVLFLWLTAQLVFDRHARSLTVNQRVVRFVACSFSVAGPAVAILGLVAWGGALQDFWMSYVIANMSYARAGGGDPLLVKVVALATTWQSRALFDGVLSFALICLLLSWRRWTTCTAPLRSFVVVSLMVGGAALLAVLTPSIAFDHQQLLLFQPLCLASGALLAAWLSLPKVTTGASQVSRRAILALYALCLLLVPLSWLPAAVSEGYFNYRLRRLTGLLAADRVAEKIRLLCPDAGSMAVWGWAPGLYVQTNRPPATRHAICHFLIDPNPAREHLRSSFLADIQRERPPIIVDAAAGDMMCWSWTSLPRVNSFPALYQHLQANYVLAGQLQLSDDNEPIRFYLSQEYVRGMRAALKQQP